MWSSQMMTKKTKTKRMKTKTKRSSKSQNKGKTNRTTRKTYIQCFRFLEGKVS